MYIVCMRGREGDQGFCRALICRSVLDVNSLGFSNNAADDLLTVGQIQPCQGLEQLCRSRFAPASHAFSARRWFVFFFFPRNLRCSWRSGAEFRVKRLTGCGYWNPSGFADTGVGLCPFKGATPQRKSSCVMVLQVSRRGPHPAGGAWMLQQSECISFFAVSYTPVQRHKPGQSFPPASDGLSLHSEVSETPPM